MLGKIEVRPVPGGKPRDGRHCDLCGCSQPAVRCDKCGCQIFCLSCDDMYHRHPKRRFHLRKAVDPTPPIPQARPVLPMKVSQLNASNPGDPSKMPLPPPRKKKSLFGSFKRSSPSLDLSPFLPKKEYSWTDRLGSIKKFMSNRPLPPLPTADDCDMEQQPTANGQSAPRGDLTFIHKRNEERAPQLPQRSPKTPEFPMVPEKDSRVPLTPGQTPGQLRNGSLEQNSNSVNHQREFQNGDENQWTNRMHSQNQNGHQPIPHQATLNRQNQRGFMPPGMPGYPGTMHQSSSATDLHNMVNTDGMPNAAPIPPHYPHYPMNPHMPPHYPYPMYPQYPNYPQYFGNSFANLSNPPTTDGDMSDQSETSLRHSSKKYPFRKRAKRSQSVMMDRMQYPGQFYPFGPFPGYGPWGAPMPMEAPPSPAGSLRSLNRTGRSRRRKKMTSEDDDEEVSASSSPMSRPKSSSSDRPPKNTQRAPLATQTTSSEDESEGERDNRRNKLNTMQRRFSDPKRPSSPAVDPKMSPKPQKRSSSRQSDSEMQDVPTCSNDRRNLMDSTAEQSSQPRLSPSSIASGSWECKHCTFVNPISNRICQVCCKTGSPRTETPVTANSRCSSATGSSRKPSVDLDKESPTPAKPQEQEDDTDKKDKRDMAMLNTALDEAEKEISRGLEELMKLKEDMDTSKDKSSETVNKGNGDTEEAASKPIYKSTGKMRTSILDKLSVNRAQPSKSSASTTTETQTGQNNWTSDKIIEARRHSNSSTTSETFNSPLAQSPELENNFFNKEKRDSSCQTQQDTLIEYLERKKAAEEAFLGRPINNFGFGFGDRMDMMTSPVPAMYDRYLGGGFGMMQRSHSRASLFTGRMNEPSPFDYGGPGFGYGGAPMYRSVSRGSLTGDYPDGRLSDFHNLRKPDFYLSMEELVERRRQETMRAQGLELVRMIREAEQHGFTAEDIQVALTHCGKQSPMEWLQDNWRNMVDSVVTLSTNYGNDKKENDIGLLSETEARDALRMHKGNIWAAVTECVESRQRKYLELSARGKFSRKDIVEALNSSEGDVEMAYAKLSKSTGKPFLMRIWGAGEGAQNQDGAQPVLDDAKDSTLRYRKEDIANSDYLSDDVWSEDGAVDWDEDDEFEDDKGDMEDLQTCHEDLFGSPQQMKTPESDKSDYCDAFPVEDRNMSSPSDDIFFVIPETKQEKKKGFLSKLAALRKDSKELVDTPKLDQESGTSAQSLQSKEDAISQNSSSGSEKTKNSGTLSSIKSTLSAIKDTVTGGAKPDKKAPCSQPERRTIIVRGKLDHESFLSDDNIKLTSMKPREDDSVKSELNEIGDIRNETSKTSNNKESKTRNGKTESLIEEKTFINTEIKPEKDNIKVETVMKNKSEKSNVQNHTEKLKFAKESVPNKLDSKSLNIQTNSSTPESSSTKNEKSSCSPKPPPDQSKTELLHKEKSYPKTKVTHETNEKAEKTNSLQNSIQPDVNNSEKLHKQNKSNKQNYSNTNENDKSQVKLNTSGSGQLQNNTKTSFKTKSPALESSNNKQHVSKAGIVDNDNRGKISSVVKQEQIQKETKHNKDQTELMGSEASKNISIKPSSESFKNFEEPLFSDNMATNTSLSKEHDNFANDKNKLDLKNDHHDSKSSERNKNEKDVVTNKSFANNDGENLSNININESEAISNVNKDVLIAENSKVEFQLSKQKDENEKDSLVKLAEKMVIASDISEKIPVDATLKAQPKSSSVLNKIEKIQQETSNRATEKVIEKVNDINKLRNEILSKGNISLVEIASSNALKAKVSTIEARNLEDDHFAIKSDKLTELPGSIGTIQEENNTDHEPENSTLIPATSSSNFTVKHEEIQLSSSVELNNSFDGKIQSSNAEESLEKQAPNQSDLSSRNNLLTTSSIEVENLVQNITPYSHAEETKFTNNVKEMKASDTPVSGIKLPQQENDINVPANKDLNQMIDNSENFLNNDLPTIGKDANIAIDTPKEVQPPLTDESSKPSKLKSGKTGKVLKKSKSQSKIGKEAPNIENIEEKKIVEPETGPESSKTSSEIQIIDDGKDINKIPDASLSNEISSNSGISGEAAVNKIESVDNILLESQKETEVRAELPKTEINVVTPELEKNIPNAEIDSKTETTETETKLQANEVETKLKAFETKIDYQTEKTVTDAEQVDTDKRLQETEAESINKTNEGETKVLNESESLEENSLHKSNLPTEQKSENTLNENEHKMSVSEASSSKTVDKKSEISEMQHANTTSRIIPEISSGVTSVSEIIEAQEIPGTSRNISSANTPHVTSSIAIIPEEPAEKKLNQITDQNDSTTELVHKSDSQSKTNIEDTSNTNVKKSSTLPEPSRADNFAKNESNSNAETAVSPKISINNEKHSKIHESIIKTPDTLNKNTESEKPVSENTLQETLAGNIVNDQEELEDDLQDSDDSRPSSVTPPSPVDALRSRFEGLAGGMSVRGPIRPNSPFRRMSFNSRKQVIALERKRETTEKPWFHQKIVHEPVKYTVPKRSIKQQLEMERKVRKMVADRKCRTYKKAEIVVQLMDMNFEEEESIQAANECSTLEQAISYLQQECLLCTGAFPVSQIVSMTHCQHRACRDCTRAYFTVQIRDRTIMDLMCPFCNQPDIGDEDIASDYFNHLDIMLKKLVDVEIHELFQRKLRDRVLMKDPNFRWCSQCSSGFIAMPNLKRLVCPDCNAVTCASCRRLWEREHQGITCEAFAALKDASDPEAQAAGLAKLLTEDGIDCPSCHFRYALAKGGCMHFRCIQCQHDFCSGCSRPFKMGQKCGVSEFCAKLGLHAHHPRNCLFYLRDKEPEDLQKLLDMNDIQYNCEPPDGMEVKNTCQVMEQKETADGMLDDCCGKEIQDGYAGLCRIHYVEYLGQLVNKYKVDPIQIFDNDDLELVLRRANIRLPPKRYRETESQYRQKLVNLIEEELPLDKMDGS